MHIKSLLIGTLISAIVVGVGMYGYYGSKIDLYKIRLRETLDEIHRLQHKIDPLHQQFQHGEESKEEEAHDHHAHGQAIDLTGSDWQPSVTLTIEEDVVGGWNVQIETTDFTFAPERASTEHIEGEGHAHLYVDGKKIARVYSSWFHIGSLGPGEQTIRVTLNANSHETLEIDGSEVSDEVVITVQ